MLGSLAPTGSRFSMPRLTPAQIKSEVLAGLTTSFAMVPESLGFAIVAGVNPLVGLYAAFMVGIVTALFGGRPGMISGGAGSVAVVTVALVATHGIEYLFAAVVLMGLIQLAVGIFRLGQLVKLIPHPVMLGFLNGLAIIIGKAQLQHFRVLDAGTGVESWLSGSSLAIMVGLVALTMAIIYFVPKVTKVVPAPLVALGVTLGITLIFGLQTKTVGNIAPIAGGLPSFHLAAVPFTLETLGIVAPYALIMAGVGMIESLLTLQVVDEMTETRGSSNQECVALGAGNILSGMFGGMGGCAMIGQTMINLTSGGRRRLSGIVEAAALLAFIVFAAPIIERIPVAALVGIMFMVVLGTFAWSSVKMIHRVPRADAVIMVIVTGVTVVQDLATAVLVGVVLTALVHAWKVANQISADVHVEADGTKVYALHGPLLFSSTEKFRDLFTPAEDPALVVADFTHTHVWDHSAIEEVKRLAAKYDKLGKTIHFRHLSEDCARKLGRYTNLVEHDEATAPTHRIILGS